MPFMGTTAVWRCLFIVWFGGWIAAGASAQERLATAGRVLDQAGKPVVGATITFVGSVPPLWDRFEPADHVEVVSDAKGRFVVQLLEWGDYDVWAAGPELADGGHMVSRVREVRPATGFEISLTKRRAASELVVKRLELWKNVDAIHVEVALSTNALHRQRVDVVKGVAKLPPRPVGLNWLMFAVNADGDIVFAERDRSGVDRIGFDVRQPGKIPVRVVDEAGKPIAGATIRGDSCRYLWGARSNSVTGTLPICRWRVLGKTDANGEVVVTMARLTNSLLYQAGMMMASHPGYRASLGGFCAGVIVDGAGAHGNKPDKVLPFTLVKAKRWGGQLIGKDGQPLGGVPLQLTGKVLIPLSQNSQTFFDTSLLVTSAADGSFSFDGIPSGLGNCLLHVGTQEQLAGPGTRAPALLAADFESPLRLDLRQLLTVELVVKDPVGQPARGARVLLVPLPMDDREVDPSTYTLRLDQRGCATVPVQAGRWQIMAINREAFGMQSLEVKRDELLVLRMQEHELVAGRVLMDAGADRGAVSCMISSWSHGNASGEGITPELGRRLNDWLARGVVVGRDGSFTWPFVPHARQQYGGHMSIGGKAKTVHLVQDEGLVVDLR